MRKLTLILFLILFAGTGLFAQQSSVSKQGFGKDTYFTKNTELKQLADNVNKNYQLMQNSSTMAKAGAQKVNQDYSDAVNLYLIALKKELAGEAKDAAIVKIVQNEINELNGIFPVEEESINKKLKN
jgi:hypothetical protein